MVNLLGMLILSIIWLLKSYLKVLLRLKRIKKKLMLNITCGTNHISLKIMQIMLCVNVFLKVSLSQFFDIVIYLSVGITLVLNALQTRFLNVGYFGLFA